jgi:hypothetical protein
MMIHTAPLLATLTQQDIQIVSEPHCRVPDVVADNCGAIQSA